MSTDFLRLVILPNPINAVPYNETVVGMKVVDGLT